MSPQQLYEKKHHRHHFFVHLLRIILFFTFLLGWELAANNQKIDPFFFSSPSRIVESAITLTHTNQLFYHIFVTLYETLISFLFIITVSVVVALFLWYFHTVSEIVDPYLVVLNSIPKSAMAPIFIVWLGTGKNTIIIAGISVAIFGAIINLYTAFKDSDPEKLKLVQTFGGCKKDQIIHVVLPGNVSIILSTMKVNIGLALVGVIIGEFLAARSGLGYLIIYGSQVFRMSMVITSLVILCIIAVILYSMLQLLEHTCKKNGII